MREKEKEKREKEKKREREREKKRRRVEFGKCLGLRKEKGKLSVYQCNEQKLSLFPPMCNSLGV